MGEKLMQYYRIVANQFGVTGRIRLAQETKIPSTRAALEEDSEENLRLFRRALAKLTNAEPPPGL